MRAWAAERDAGEPAREELALPCGSPASEQYIGTSDRLGLSPATEYEPPTIWCRTHRRWETLTTEQYETLASLRRHPFAPIPLYDANGENPIWTDWCGHLDRPLQDAQPGDVCGKLAGEHLPRSDDEPERR